MGVDAKEKKQLIPLYGKVTGIGYDGDKECYQLQVDCPWDDNPDLEKVKGGASAWMSCVVQVTFIRKK